MPAVLWIDSLREIHCTYTGDRQFLVQLVERGKRESPEVRWAGDNFASLINLRRTITAIPVTFSRDGVDVVAFWTEHPKNKVEWARCSSESFRDMVLRSIRVSRQP